MPTSFSPSDILYFFYKNDGRFINRKGLILEMISDDSFKVSTPLTIQAEMANCPPIRLEVKHYGMSELLNDYQVSSLNFIKNKLSVNDMYELYYSLGRGQVIVTLTDYLECPVLTPVELYFEHVPENNGKTKVYAPYLNYYDEIDESFFEEEEYIEYVQKHRHLLIWLLENKFRIQFCKNLGSDECQN